MRYRSVLSNKTKVEEAVSNCSSVKECLIFLELRPAGGNYKQFYDWCKKHNIVPPRGDGSIAIRGIYSKPKISLEEILIVGSSYDRVALKRRLIKELLLEEKCYECGLLPEWNGKILCLQLDHINGIANDNRINNLRLLCPNCHSQTLTFAGRRKAYSKKERSNSGVYHCSQCSASITKFSRLKLCRKCASTRANFSRRRVERPSREDLFNLVWSQPTSSIAEALGVSGKAIEKWCKGYGISKPPRGYWNKQYQLRNTNET